LAIHVSVWTIALAAAPTFIPVRQLIAEGFSTLAVVCMSVNLVLSTRSPVLERLLRGLDKLFVTHRTIGLSVALLVGTHYLVVPKSVGWVTSKPFGYTTLALVLTVVFVASAPRFPWRRLVPLAYQTWKSSHRLNGVLVALAVTHSLYAHTYVKTNPGLAVYVYGIAALGLCAWLYREFAFRRFGPFRAFTVERSGAIGDDVTEVMLASSCGAVARKSGQFAFVSFAGGPSREQHPFTMSSGAGSDIRFSIKASGDFTKALQSGVAVGSAVTIEGPYGAFDYRLGLPRQLWLAGGIGITPFLSMAADLDEETAVTLVWSVHDRGEAVYEPELVRLCEEKANLRFSVHSTSSEGHLDVATLTSGIDRRAHSYFICGPVPMRQALVRQLRSLGVSRDQVHFEEFRLR
jgi:predicted ferric reductase